MFKLYKKEEFVVGTYLKYPNNETSLLLLKKDGVEAVILDIDNTLVEPHGWGRSLGGGHGYPL